jgi:hypothetical protein
MQRGGVIFFHTNAAEDDITGSQVLQAQAMKDDPMLNKDAVRVCTACSMLEGMGTLQQQLPGITCPGAMTCFLWQGCCLLFRLRVVTQAVSTGPYGEN